ncbi:MAG: glycosyltransferase family 39 protein [Candidatus Saccharibacteria bacterium]|nr:glycosyltransferase family 39 protein [Pseudorhodobacter sp.]
MSGPDPRGWIVPCLLVVGAITILRLALLAFNRTDLFVDEAQYWLWGQDFAFGYYSKPPLIAWLIGGVTALAGSDAPFWIRMPGAILHGSTALILAAIAARLHSPRAAGWVAATYVTLPFVALGSLLISTDSVMAPFFAAAIHFHLRLIDSRNWRYALLTGVMLGLACLAKYAGVYFLIGAVIAAIFNRGMRPSVTQWTVLLISFAAVISPNIVWNLNHQFSTVTHTLDNVGWVEQTSPFASLNPLNAVTFLVSQFGVFGPVTFAALGLALLRRRTLGLGTFVWPVLAIVTVQAALDNAYANWALSAYFVGTIVAVLMLMPHPRWWAVSLLLNGTLSLALPILTVFPQTGPQDKPYLARYLGRADLSAQLIALARQDGAAVIVADRRDIIADLFYTGRDAGLTFYTLRPPGRPENHYEQTYPAPADLTQPVVYVGSRPPTCPAKAAPLTLTGTYAKTRLQAYLIAPVCLPFAD